jgi:transcription elongation factor Elf1
MPIDETIDSRKSQTYCEKGMTCPKCAHAGSSVIDSRPSKWGIRRRRKCDACAFRFTTLEVKLHQANDPEFLIHLLRSIKKKQGGVATG